MVDETAFLPILRITPSTSNLDKLPPMDAIGQNWLTWLGHFSEMEIGRIQVMPIRSSLVEREEMKNLGRQGKMRCKISDREEH